MLEIIEESLFRQPDSTTEAFNLEAYREMFLLYSVAKEIIDVEPDAVVAVNRFDLPDRPGDSVDSRRMTFKSTAIQPLSASMDTNQPAGRTTAAENLMASVIAPASASVGLDIDLSQLSNLGNTSNFEAASDAEFFAQFDADETVVLPSPDFAPLAPAGGTIDIDNLIDFDDIDVPRKASVKPRLPGV